MLLLGFILILNLHVIVFSFVAKIISKLPVCTWICQWYVPFSEKKVSFFYDCILKSCFNIVFDTNSNTFHIKKFRRKCSNNLFDFIESIRKNTCRLFHNRYEKNLFNGSFFFIKLGFKKSRYLSLNKKLSHHLTEHF